MASQPPLLSFQHQQQIIDLKVAACRVLSTTHYIDSQKSSTLAALFKGICSDSPAIHKIAFECIREFVSHTTIDLELRHTYVKPILQNIRQVANLRLSTIRQLAYCAELFPSTFSERFCDAIHCHLNAFVELISNRPEAVSKFGASQQPVELASSLIDLYHLIPLATEKYVGILIGQVIRMEQLLNIELTSPLRLPLVRFLVRYPEETFRQFLHGSIWPYDAHAHRLLLFAVTCSEGLPLVTYLESHVGLLADVLKISDTDSSLSEAQILIDSQVVFFPQLLRVQPNLFHTKAGSPKPDISFVSNGVGEARFRLPDSPPTARIGTLLEKMFSDVVFANSGIMHTHRTVDYAQRDNAPTPNLHYFKIVNYGI
ncbi:unnamed protein product [Dibothriocephalus latus]|uniref:Uncharacterized protein n=1 Tax=Dibothriocephalus latus TaxID=60516 RepID=A0A3P6PLS7_DIBLA|nr:unnamed protein product [Dibothriocephalus latus]